MNANMTGFRGFSKTLHPCALDEGGLSIREAKCVCNHAQPVGPLKREQLSPAVMLRVNSTNEKHPLNLRFF